MSVLLHHLDRTTRVSWGISATAELGALLSADLRVARRTADPEPCAQRLERFGSLYEGRRSLLFYTGPIDDDRDADADPLEPLRALDDDEFRRLWELTSPMEEFPAGTSPDAPSSLRDILDQELGLFVAERFREHWDRTAPNLEHHVAQARRIWRREGLAEAIVRCVRAAVHGGSPDSVIIDKIYDLTVDASVRAVRLLPTTLNWPQVIVKDEDEIVQIHYSAAPQGSRPFVSSAHVTTQMAALCRQHSLEILREIAKHPVGTMEISQRLDIDPATVSRTAKDLAAASLISTQARGRARIHRLNLEEFEALGSNLWQVITR